MRHLGVDIQNNIRRLGKSVVLQGDDGRVETWAIIDPVHSVSESARNHDALADGYFPPGSYQYFGLPEANLTGITEIIDQETVYFLRRKELYEVGGEKLYWWALMIRGGGADVANET